MYVSPPQDVLIFRYPPLDFVTPNIQYPPVLRLQKLEISSIKSIRLDSGFTT